VEAVGLGALGGALGAGLAGPLGGRLVSEALDGVLPQAATQGLVGAGSGAVSGGVTALARCGMNCGRDCSVSGALSAAGAGALAGGVGGAAFGALGGLRARGRSSAEEPAACPIHSFTASTKVLLADGSSKPIFSLKVGDRVANSQPGKAEVEAHPVDRVIVTETDHDFVDLKVKPSRIRRAAAGLAVAAAVVTGGAVPASAAPATVTTTYHHPFYDVTRGEFVEAVNLQVGDRLQSVDGGEATVEEVTPYHSTEVTYDLTIDQLHTYYVFAGDVPVLVHNCGNSAAHDAQNIAENLDDNVYFHYTSEGGHAGIVAPGGGLRIGANAGKVHVTQEMGSPAEVEQNIFIGNPKYSGKADFLVAFRMSEGVELRPGSQPNEMIFDGSLKVPARNVIYHGRNPF
jgi:hypothetical protein